jgi:tetratricopeptide (TPR) repeat protein
MRFSNLTVYGAVWLEIARMHFHSRRYKSALCAVRQAIYDNPHNVEAWHLAGIIFQQVRRPAAALRSFNRALRLDPNDYVTWYSRGQILETLGDHQGAISCYGSVIALNPTYQNAQHRRDRLIVRQLHPKPIDR